MVERDERLEGLSGKTLAERYHLKKERARGSFCVVYEADDDVLRRPVAVKAVSTEQASVYREAIAATAGLSHPAFVAVYDTFEQDGVFFVIQELLDCRPLTDYLSEGAPVRRVVSLALQVSRAVAYAHQHDVAHGDVTPTSVLIDRNANLFLNNACLPADWAYFEAAMVETAAISGRAPAAHGDNDRVELAQTVRDNPRVRDVWSIGVLMVMLLSSDEPNQQRRVFRSDVPDHLRDLIARALKTDDGTDLLSAAALAEQLETLEGSLSQSTLERVGTAPIAVRAFREAHARAGSRRTASQPIRRLVQPLDDDLFYEPTLSDFGEPAETDSSQTRPADDALFAATLRRANPSGRPPFDTRRSSAPATYRPDVTQKRPAAYYAPEPYPYGNNGWPDGGVARSSGSRVMRTWVWTLIGIALFVASFLLGFLVFPQFRFF